MIFRRIRHLVSWLPIIWADQDWNGDFLMTILNRKLSNMERFFSSDRTHLANSDKTRARIQYARILTDRILTDEYFSMAFKAHGKKWGEPVYESIPNEDRPTSTLTISYPNVNTKRDGELCHRDARAAISHSDAMKKQDIDELFATMAKYIQGWWD